MYSLDVSTLETILRNAPVFIVLLDADLVLAYVNKVAPPLVAEEVIGRHYSTFYTPEEARRMHRAYELARETRRAQSLESLIDLPDDRRWFLVTTSALWHDDGEFAGWINISTEITARKQAEMTLHRAQAELADASRRAGMAEVATGILHNIGNVLNSINTSTTTLIERTESSHIETLSRLVALAENKGDALPDYLAHDPKGRKLPALLSRLSVEIAAERKAMRAEIERLIGILDLTCATLDAQQSVATTGASVEHIDLAELVHRALSMFRIELADQNIAVSIAIAGDQRVLLDTRATLQILVNLIRSSITALKDAAGPRSLTIEVSATAELVSFDIIDNGCGITAADLPRLFDHGLTTQDGHGVGLHAAAIAAQALDGSITATSGGPGRGARFRLLLPRRQPAG